MSKSFSQSFTQGFFGAFTVTAASAGIMTAVLVGSLTGCKDRNRAGTSTGSSTAAAPGEMTEDEKAQREAAEKAEALRQELAEKAEAKRVEIARKNLQERIRLFKAVAGEFYGRYPSRSGGPLELQTRIHLQADHIPADYVIDRATRESEIQALSNEMSLTADTDDRGVGDNFRIISCSTSAIKPDFYAGIVRIVCATPLNGTTRVYILGFDSPNSEFDGGSTAEVSKTRAKNTAQELGTGKLDRIDAYSMTIIGTEKDLQGRLTRLIGSVRQ